MLKVAWNNRNLSECEPSLSCVFANHLVETTLCGLTAKPLKQANTYTDTIGHKVSEMEKEGARKCFSNNESSLERFLVNNSQTVYPKDEGDVMR